MTTQTDIKHLQKGNFHTHANLTQTIQNIMNQHYRSVHTSEEKNAADLPLFISEAIHMICHNLASTANGNAMFPEHWKEIAIYANNVAEILEQAHLQAQKKAAELAEKQSEDTQAEAANE